MTNLSAGKSLSMKGFYGLFEVIWENIEAEYHGKYIVCIMP